MRTVDFDFDLPEDRIALHPAEPRDSARMLRVDPARAQDQEYAPALSDKSVRDLPNLLRAGDVLVVNDTKVLPAALKGVRRRGDSAVEIEANLVRRRDLATWAAFARPGRRLAIADRIDFAAGPDRPALVATVEEKSDGGLIALRFEQSGADLDAALQANGAMPLPPYIASRRPATQADDATYQTVFAARTGAVAAPTAALHFTERLLEDLDRAGIRRVTLTLHVGAGTFLPVKVDRPEDHKMHAEWGELTAEAVAAINAARAGGGRIVAVGTTALRLLETAAATDGKIAPFCGQTDIFITPGYRFRAVDVLMTNFHLPRSTLFMLVAAFSGLDLMQAAYAHAVRNGYRFYSYGDATLLFRQTDPQGGESSQ